MDGRIGQIKARHILLEVVYACEHYTSLNKTKIPATSSDAIV